MSLSKVIETIYLHRTVLDPEVWQAVGKIENWKNNATKYPWCAREPWENKMHDMIDALAEGKTIEEFLETL